MRPPYGVNCLVTIGGLSYAVMKTSGSFVGAWVDVLNGRALLSCWWAAPRLKHLLFSSSFLYIVYLACTNRVVWFVLCECLGAQRGGSPAHDHPALVLHIFSCTAPHFELAYEY